MPIKILSNHSPSRCATVEFYLQRRYDDSITNKVKSKLKQSKEIIITLRKVIAI